MKRTAVGLFAGIGITLLVTIVSTAICLYFYSLNGQVPEIVALARAIASLLTVLILELV